MSFLRALAKPLSDPIFTKPHFSNTFWDPKLSKATRPKIGLVFTITSKFFSAVVAIPFPQKLLSIQ